MGRFASHVGEALSGLPEKRALEARSEEDMAATIQGTGTRQQAFFTPELFAQEQTRRMVTPRGKLLIAGCCSGSYLSSRVVERYKELLADAGSSEVIQSLEDIDRDRKSVV